MRNLNLISSIMIIAIILPNLNMFQDSQNNFNTSDPKEIALNFIINAPTYKFDGLKYSIKVIKFDELESLPIQYISTIEFSCLHSGYGDRTDKNLLQVITKHTAIIKVVDGKIVSAIIDRVWDEISQKLIILSSEEIEQIALEWLYNSPTFKFDGIIESVNVVEIWQALTFAPPSFWQITIEFDSTHTGYGNRKNMYLAQVITHHTIVIHVTEGIIDLAIIDNIWDELTQKYVSDIYNEEKAKLISLEWLYRSPTFSFDGIRESVKIIQINTLTIPLSWEISIEFTCNYPGYGNRTGNIQLGMAQNHIIIITIFNDKVIRAIIDDIWNEMSQEML